MPEQVDFLPGRILLTTEPKAPVNNRYRLLFLFRQQAQCNLEEVLTVGRGREG